MLPPYLLASVLRFADAETLLRAQEAFQEELQNERLWMLLCQQRRCGAKSGLLWREHFWSRHRLCTNWLTGKCSTVHQKETASDEAFLSIGPLMAVALPCGSPSATIHCLEAKDREEIYSQHCHGITCVCQEGPYVAVADCVGRVTVWLRGASGSRPLAVFEGGGAEVGALLLDVGRLVAAGAEDGSVALYPWPGAAAAPVRLQYSASPVTALERGLVIGHADGTVARYEDGAVSVVASIESAVYCLARTRNSAVAAGGADGRVHILGDGGAHGAFRASHAGGVVCVHRSRLLLLVGTADGVVQAWHPTELRKLWELQEDRGRIIWRLHSTDEHLLSSSIGGGLRVRSFG